MFDSGFINFEMGSGQAQRPATVRVLFDVIFDQISKDVIFNLFRYGMDMGR